VRLTFYLNCLAFNLFENSKVVHHLLIVKGWHRRMNVKAQGLALPLYQIIPLLREAEIVQTRIAAGDLERNHEGYRYSAPLAGR
jgi:hypothetical protein